MMQRMIKTYFILGLVLALTFTTALPIYAGEDSKTKTENSTIVNSKIQKDEAVEIAKSKVNIPEKFELNSVSFNSSWGYPDKSVWYLSWFYSENNRSNGSISVGIDSETGDIVFIDRYQSSNEVTYFPAKVSITEAKEIADQFIKDFYPEIIDNIQVDQSYIDSYKPSLSNPIFYNFPYRQMVNGIPFNNQSVTVQVNGDGVVTNFHYNSLQYIDFKAGQKTISLEEAKERYAELLNMNLRWVYPYRSFDQQVVPYLSYLSSYNTLMINAETGELFNYAWQIQETEDIKPLVDKPLVEKPVVGDKELTQEEILKLARKYVDYFGVDVKEFRDIRYDSNNYPTHHGVWNISLTQERDDNGYNYFGNISIDAISGEVLTFYYHNYEIYEKEQKKETKNVMTYDEAKELAIKTIKEIATSKAHQVYLQEFNLNNSEELRAANFQFKRLVHGIPAERETIHLAVDLQTGKIIEFNMFWNEGDIKYPEELPETISIDTAKELILKNLNLELVYNIVYPDPYMYKTNAENKKPQAVLVYKPVNKYEESGFLDATTGEWRNLSDGSLINIEKPEDIKGHWAEKELELMVDYKALDLIDGKVMPEKALTRGEMLKMFFMASSGGQYYPMAASRQYFADVAVKSQYAGFVEAAVNMNLLTPDENKKFKPEEEVTREELAQFIVKALGYDKLAQTNGLFQRQFTDQDVSDYSGHISIVGKLGIMKGELGRFNPTKKVTRADAAVSFYQFLTVRNQYNENNRPPYPMFYY